MYYVYDWNNDRILQAEEYLPSAGQEISFSGVCGNHIYTNRGMLGNTPEEACQKAAVYCQAQLDRLQVEIERGKKEAGDWLLRKTIALTAIPR